MRDGGRSSRVSRLTMACLAGRDSASVVHVSSACERVAEWSPIRHADGGRILGLLFLYPQFTHQLVILSLWSQSIPGLSSPLPFDRAHCRFFEHFFLFIFPFLFFLSLFLSSFPLLLLAYVLSQSVSIATSPDTFRRCLFSTRYLHPEHNVAFTVPALISRSLRYVYIAPHKVPHFALSASLPTISLVPHTTLLPAATLNT